MGNLQELLLEMYAGEMEGVKAPTDFTISSSFTDDMHEEDKSTDKFIYAYTVSGISRNKRNWMPEVVRSIGQQVLEKMPVGQLGHIKPDDVAYVLPEPQVVWFGTAEEPFKDKDGNDQIRLWLKGYVLPTATKAKIWIKTKAIDSISVWGIVSQRTVDGIDVIDSVDLKSIDLSRKLGEGLPAYITGIASEMDGSFDEIRESLMNSVRDHFNCGWNDVTKTDTWCGIHKIYPNSVIVRHSVRKERSRVEDKTLYKIDYKIVDDKVVPDFKNMVEVEPAYVKKGTTEVVKGYASEMDGSFDDLREAVNNEVSKHYHKNKGPDDYIYAYVVKQYVDKLIAEITNNGDRRLVQLNYTIDKDGVKVDFDSEIEVELAYIPKTKKKVEASEMDYSKLTVADIKANNPELINQIIADAQHNAEAQAEVETNNALAAEMNNVMDICGVETAQEAIDIINDVIASVGEMAEDFEVATEEEVAGEQAGECAGSKRKKSASEIAKGVKEKAKKTRANKAELKALLTELNEIASVGEGEDIKTKLQKFVNDEKTAFNKSQISDVAKRFGEMTSEIKNEVVMDYLKDDFASALEMKAEDVPGADWAKNVIADMEAKMPELIKKHTDRLGRISKASKVAGEMSGIVNLGNGMANSSEQQEEKSYDDMTPDEIATKLGY